MKKISGILLILVFGLLLRIISLNQSFWLDEATSGIVVRDLSFAQILTNFSPGDFHPPFYYLILKLWSIVFGTSEIVLRLLSVLVGLLTVFVVYKISEILSFKSKFVAPLLLATSGLHIYYSQEARMYSLATLFVTLTVYFFVKLVKGVKEKEGRVGEWFMFGLLLLLSIGTHYLTVFVIPVFWLSIIFNKKRPDWKQKFVASHILLIIGGILWFPTLLKQLELGIGVNTNSPLWGEILGQTSFKQIALVPTKFALGRVSFDDDLAYLAVVLLVSFVFGYLFIKAFKTFRENKIFWTWLMVPVGLAMVFGFFVPVFNYFRLLYTIPAFYLVLAQGISNSRYSKTFLIAVLLINILSSIYYLANPKFHREDWRGLVTAIESGRAENSQVLFVADSQMEGYKYYAPDAKIQGPSRLDTDSGEVWLIRYVKEIFDPEDKLRQNVERGGFTRVSEYDFNGIPVYKYERK